ncbi:FecR family protein [Pedobacter nyackensis]|uniref:FecR family protein n=1 Tax=Pedobacter nyackensis TaxID=475255 RepID=A0A1W2B0T9_9SPHI|nr:FecR family protein [Pedobacter nyackensis]SMC66573.1 FecR family protein [Pedobacter nyackensis]
MENEIAKGLIEKYVNGTCTAEEKAIVESWYLNLALEANDDDLDAPDFEKAFSRLSKSLPLQREKQFNFKRLTAAAAVLLLLAAGGWFFKARYENESGKEASLSLKRNDVAPGKNIAVLTLANGKTIRLSDAKTGVVIDADALTYNDGSKISSASAESSILDKALLKASTPRGGTYQITLPDDTKVWLNSASSLKFPPSFKGHSTRRVELSGEAYFEVAKMERMPFVVVTDKQEVEVLGTHFNVNSYADEEVTKTTLLEGSVKVSAIGKNMVKAINKLKPGQQSRINNSLPGKMIIEPANIEQVMAWKNGYFHFENDNLPTVMRQLSRWYDIEIVYQVDRMDDEFIGDIPRNVKLSEVLKVLEYGSGVHFKIENRKLIVTK